MEKQTIEFSKKKFKKNIFFKFNSRLKRVSFKRMMSYWRRFDIFFSTFGYADKRLFNDRLKFVKNYAIDVIETRRKLLLQKLNTETLNNEHNEDKNNGKCFLDILLQSVIDGLPLTNDEILDEVQSFMVAVSSYILKHMILVQSVFFLLSPTATSSILFVRVLFVSSLFCDSSSVVIFDCCCSVERLALGGATFSVSTKMSYH